MFGIVKRYKLYIILLLGLMIAEPSLNSVLNFWLQRLFNMAKPGADKIAILRLLTGGFLMWAAKRIITFTSGVIRACFMCNAKYDVKRSIFAHIIGIDMATLSGIASSGEYISIFTNDIAMLETRFFSQIISLFADIFSVIILGASFLALNRTLAISILCFGVVSMSMPAFFSRMLNEKSLLYSQTISQFTQKLKEYVSSFPTIKNYAIEREIVERFNRINRESEYAKFDADYALNLANTVGQLLAWFMQFIAVGMGLMMVLRGDILVGTVIAAQSFASDLASPLQDIIFNVNSIRSVRDIVKRIKALSTQTRDAGEADPPEGKRSAHASAAGAKDLTFSDVRLKLGGQVIIDGFSFHFEAGKKYLILGLNGAGKSSIFKALKRWYPLSSGAICVGGRDVRTMSNDELSHNISYLNEKVSLFSGTVKENITLFREIGRDHLDSAVGGAQVRLNLDRQIADEGTNISSGEQRRIEIARSLLNSVNILIFDEVVSTLDIETAYEIEKMALSLKQHTVVFISHHFSGKLVREYDDILVIDRGRLLAHGRFDELLQSCDYFRKICGIKLGI